jgi:hypothetical protein
LNSNTSVTYRKRPAKSTDVTSAVAAAEFLDGHACFSLLEEADDLLIGKSCGLDIRNSPKFADQLPLPWYG